MQQQERTMWTWIVSMHCSNCKLAVWKWSFLTDSSRIFWFASILFCLKWLNYAVLTALSRCMYLSICLCQLLQHKQVVSEFAVHRCILFTAKVKSCLSHIILLINSSFFSQLKHKNYVKNKAFKTLCTPLFEGLVPH